MPITGKLARAWAPGGVACLVLLGSATGALGAASAATPMSSVAPSPVPRPGSSSELSGVACPLPASCWAVGDYHTSGSSLTFLNQALHWNGRRWSQVTTPDPGSSTMGALDGLSAVRCTSAGSCWAVGTFAEPVGTSAAFQNQALTGTGGAGPWSLPPIRAASATTTQAA